MTPDQFEYHFSNLRPFAINGVRIDCAVKGSAIIEFQINDDGGPSFWVAAIDLEGFDVRDGSKTTVRLAEYHRLFEDIRHAIECGDERDAVKVAIIKHQGDR